MPNRWLKWESHMSLMNWAVRLLGVLTGWLMFGWGLVIADSGWMGGDSPEFGVPISGLGVFLFLFTISKLSAPRRVPTSQMLVIIVGVALLAAGASWIAVSPRILPVIGFVFTAAGLLLLVLGRPIANSIRRLTTSSLTASFSVVNYSFSPGTVTEEQTTVASITVSGGNTGQCTVSFWKDAPLWPDGKVGEFSFPHDGTTTTAAEHFTPASGGRYHMDLDHGTDHLWTQPNDSSRLVAIPDTLSPVG